MVRHKTKQEAEAEEQEKLKKFTKGANADAPAVEPTAITKTDDKTDTPPKPRKKPKPRNLQFIGFKLNADYKRGLEAAAEASGLGLSEFLRQMVLNQMKDLNIKPIPSEGEK